VTVGTDSRTWSVLIGGELRSARSGETIDVVNAALRHIENELIARRQRTGEQRASQQRAGK